MNTRLAHLLVVVVIALSAFGALGFAPPNASAESGCAVNAWMNSSATVGTGSFRCATDDNGNRQMQICVQEYWSGATYGCRTWNTWTYSNTLNSYSYACTYYTTTRRAWVWFLGEDGSTKVVVSTWYVCSAPPMGDVNLGPYAGGGLHADQLSTLCCPGADCTVSAGTPSRVGGWVTGRGWYVSGCGTRQIQVCVQLTSGATAGCKTMWATNTQWYNGTAYYSPGAARTWYWVSGVGTFVSGYV